MKKLLALLILCTISFTTIAQDSQDVITLQNGSVIVGKITEFNFNENLTVQTDDGYGFMFRTQDVKSITKEQNARKLSQDERFKMVMPENNANYQNNALTNQTYSGSNYKSTQGYNQLSHLANAQSSNIPQNRYPSSSTNQFQQRYSSTQPNITSNYYSKDNTVPQHAANPYQNTQNALNTRTGVPQQNTYNYSPTQQTSPNYSGTLTGNQQLPYDQNSRERQQNYAHSTPLRSTNQLGMVAAAPIPTRTNTIANPDIFTDVNTLGKVTTSPKINCMEGFGDFCFINNANKKVLVTLQKKQKDGYYGDYKEIEVNSNTKGYFRSIKLGEYPFFVKIKNAANGQTNYVVLGRGSISAQQCKTEYITINY
ncbi:hypothetical protein J8281_11750 [Aquimarina sp. U1-2]|uniref:hypothetical protein n=1 Tax=Aquimarina sp. U1-2 TaxID=2823141 RepID=UPI001AECFB88|nr:hypothetical protein [Aquimarina sp. U1-2]MBP2832861.1 hypothetical protein [Aquimarina sp. U1-2]